MATTENKPLRGSIIDDFLQVTKDRGEAGSFRNYKFLQDLFLEFAGTQAFEMATQETRLEWLNRFQLISDTVFDLETMAANKFEPVAAPG